MCVHVVMRGAKGRGYARLLAAYASPPPRTEAVAAGDTRRSLPFSNSPRAGSAWAS